MKLEKDFKFKDIQYTRPDCEAFQKLAEDNAEKIKNAVSYSEAKKIFLEFDKAESEFFDMANIAYIRHTIDTSDEFYDKGNDFLNEKTIDEFHSNLINNNSDFFRTKPSDEMMNRCLMVQFPVKSYRFKIKPFNLKDFPLY